MAANAGSSMNPRIAIDHGWGLMKPSISPAARASVFSLCDTVPGRGRPDANGKALLASWCAMIAIPICRRSFWVLDRAAA